MTPKSSQANWHLIHHHHITKLFYLLNQNTMFIIDNKTLTSKLYIASITKNLSIHHSSYSLFQIIQQLTQTQFFPVNFKPYYFGTKYHKREQTPSTLLTSQYSILHLFSTNSVSRRSVNCPFISASNSIISQNNTTRFATELQVKGIFNLESEYHSQHNSHG